jgi:hypothetical protein
MTRRHRFATACAALLLISLVEAHAEPGLRMRGTAAQTIESTSQGQYAPPPQVAGRPLSPRQRELAQDARRADAASTGYVYAPVQQGTAYYCQQSDAYYPQVTSCASGWIAVMF